ncbi:MFS transporter [Virgibacillus byunsanensis]|uniref:MFS transporter n=1 Tax=Virgibacillus byunsanensis TaxID=570945 RepID=A0ABW3LPE2_9BACI
MNRWMHLAGYALLIFSSQILWVTFSPITTDVAKDMNSSVGGIGTLTALFPIVYIVIALPAGRWLDSHFRMALTFGALTVGLGAAARLIFPFDYTWQLVIQIILAVGQPFVINSISVYASRYFPEKNRSLAISISSVSIFLGVIFAMVLSPLLYANGGLMNVLIVFTIPSVIGMLWVTYTLVSVPFSSKVIIGNVSTSLSLLIRDKFLWVLSGLLAIGLGVFNTLSTWLEPIFLQYGITGTLSGPLLALMLVSGIIGSMILPTWAIKKDLRRFVGIITFTIAATAFFAIAMWQSILWIAFWFVFVGFFLLPGFPIIVDWTEKHFPKSQQGTAVGFVMLASHAGGIILIYLVKAFLTPPYLALGIFAFVNILGILLAFQLPKPNKQTSLSMGVPNHKKM